MIDASWAKPSRKLSPRSANVLAVPLGISAFIVALVLGAILHLDLPATRQMARGLTVQIFNQAFRGQIAITELSRLGLHGLTASGVTIMDPQKRPVVQAAELHADLDLLVLLFRLANFAKRIDIELDQVTLRRPAVYLLGTKERGPDGEPLGHPSIADAFSPRHPTPDDQSAGTPVRVWFPEVRLERFYLRGTIGGEFSGEAQVPLAQATVLVTDRGVRVEVERFGLRVSGFGGVDTIAVGEVSMQLPGAIAGSVRGRIGSIPIEQTFRVDGDHLLVEGALPKLEASALRPLLSAWPLEGTIGLTNRIEGTLPRLNAEVVVTAGTGKVRASGLLTTSPALEADLDVDTKDLDLSALGPQWPQTRLNLRSAVEVWLTKQRPNLEVNATLAESEFRGTPLPVVDIWATYDERGLEADATLHERGLPVHLAVSGQPGKRLDFEVTVRRTALHESPRLAALVNARGEVAGEVKGHLDGVEKVTAQWSLAGNGLDVNGIGIKRVQTTGGATVDLQNLDRATIDLTVEGEDFTASGIVIPKLRLQARGPLERPTVGLEATTALGAPVLVAATVHPEVPAISNLTGHIGQADEEVGLALDHGSFAGGEVVLRGLEITSGGKLSGDLTVRGRGGEAQLFARGFDLRTLVASFGLDRTRLSGQLDLDVDARVGDQATGHARIKLTDAALAGIAGVQTELSAEFDGRKVMGQSEFAVDGAFHGSADWDLVLAGPMGIPESYRYSVGAVRLDLEEVQLAWLRSFLPEQADVSRVSGTASLHLEAERSQRTAFPDLRLVAKTNGLSLDVGTGADLRRFDAMDGSLRSSINHDKQRVEAALAVKDAEGDLVSVTGGLALPLSEWILDPPSGQALTTAVRTAQLECVLLVPERRIVEFPAALGLPAWDGRLAARAILRGSIEDPEIDVSTSAMDVEGADLGLLRPISLELTARYRLSSGHLTGSLQARQGHARVASAAVKLHLPMSSLTSPVPAGTPAWTGAAQVVVEDAPMGLFAALTRQKLTGAMQGSIGITRKGYPIDADASLRLTELALEETALGEANMTMSMHDQALRGTVRLEDEFGTLDAEGTLSVLPTPWAVVVDDKAEIVVSVRSQGHDAAILAPFVATTLSEISGELNGDIHLRLRPATTEGAAMEATLTGQLTMEDGIVTPTAMGLRFADTNFSVRAHRQGEFNVLQLTGLRAKARSGSDNVRGEGTVYLSGLTFHHASFRLEQQQLPLMKAGAQIASVTGTLRGEFTSKDELQELKLDLSGLKVDLPSIADSNVIEISDNPTVEVIQRPREEEAAGAEKSTTPLHVSVDLGRGVKVESDLFKVTVRGRPEVQIAETTSIGGQISLQKGGSIMVLGKVFQIEQGLIAFDSYDAANPHLDVTATWRASSGVLVRAKISGTARNPTLEWSSDPPLAGGEAEVVALVIGGGGAASKSGGQSRGAAMAGAAMAVNQLIGETGIRNLEFYAGSESEATEGEVARLTQGTMESYTASIQVTDELWFQGSYKQQSAGPGMEVHQGFSGTLDWRFAPSWTASTEVGMLGVGLDLLWQHRY